LQQIDCRGQACPMPVIQVQQALKENQYPLQILVDRDEAAVNIETLLVNSQCQFVASQSQGLYRFEVTRGCEEAPALELPLPKSRAWLITGRTLGRGSEELGRVLMKSFLFTLSEQLPGTLYFLNDGVLLTAGEGALTEHLGKLQELGWHLLSCGTCLDYHGLKDQLRVGTITNMFEIVQGIAGPGGAITI